MAKKKNNKSGGENNNNNDVAEKKNGDGGEKNSGAGGEKKKEDGPIPIVLKVDMHCEGCATKIVKCVKDIQGVESVKSEFQANKLTVVGNVDPTQLKDKLAAKTKKKVDLVSPQPKKDNKDDAKKNQPEKGNDDNKKPKEVPVTTAVLKLNLHCQGCIGKIQKTVSKTKGFHDMSIDRQKDLVTVKGSMDMKELAETLKEKLKRPVDIVPPKKEKEKEKEKGENNGGGGGGGDKKKKEEEGGNGGGKMEGHKMEYPVGLPGFGQVPYGMVYGPGFGAGYGYPPHALPPQTLPPQAPYMGNPLHAPQMFSDENPNACSIM
ncbi:unnamed protein product [Prunus armeniaca]|uniref:HMA domain-containing protein n=1 Tax=Prunus armeniaca TaxID=36596 RepID=A0A6J5V1C4_PRUAR|nr:unnamed protein product [Prunus armeniaca]